MFHSNLTNGMARPPKSLEGLEEFDDEISMAKFNDVKTQIIFGDPFDDVYNFGGSDFGKLEFYKYIYSFKNK